MTTSTAVEEMNIRTNELLRRSIPETSGLVCKNDGSGESNSLFWRYLLQEYQHTEANRDFVNESQPNLIVWLIDATGIALVVLIGLSVQLLKIHERANR